MSESTSKFMCGPFKKNTWDSSSSLSLSATIPAGFHSQELLGPLFLPLEPWLREPGVGLGPLSPQPKYPSHLLTTSHGCGTNSFCVSASPTSLEIAFSVYP